MKKFRVGIIGTGFGARVHAPMFKNHEGFEPVAIASVSRGNIEEARETSGIENVYTDWRLMLEKEELDLLVVASAVHLHHEMTEAAYQKGVHVLCEKPMAFDTAEVEEMVKAKERSGNMGLINHEFRFLPARLKVKEVLDSGKLGNILHVRYLCSFASLNALTSRARGWLGQAEKGGGMLGAIGSHMTDSLQWWMGSQYSEVFANLPIHVPVQTDSEGNTEHRTADDGFQVIGTLGNGTTVTMELISAARKTANDWRLEIFGTNGTLLMLDDKEVFLSEGDEPLEKEELLKDLNAPESMPAVAARYYNAFNRMLDALYESLDRGQKHPYLADFDSGKNTQQVLDAIRLSSKEGRKINLG